MLKQNEGPVDRGIRIVLGIVLVVASYFYLSDVPQIVGYIAGGAALITGVLGFCGLYALFGVSTCPVKK